jgi:hypothetical protein
MGWVRLRELSGISKSRDVTLPPPPYDGYIIEDCKTIVLEESETCANETL